MKRRLLLPTLCLLLCAPTSHATEDSPVFVVKNEAIALADDQDVGDSELARSADGTLCQAWVTTSAQHAFLHLSRFDFARRTWAPPQTVTSTSRAEPGDRLSSPKLALGPGGHWAALWLKGSTAYVSTSADAGASWSPPAPLTGESKAQASATLTALPDGRFLAAWTDLRDKAPSLRARIIGSDGPDALVDPRANAPGPLALAAFPDGSALLAYRGADADHVRDLRTARYENGGWRPPATLNADGWKAPDATTEGPALDIRGNHLAVAWFTAAEGARINVSTSSNAGAQWLMPNRVDDIAPLGRPSIAMLDDGSALVAWVERDGRGESVFLRRLSSRGNLSVPVRLAQNIAGHPRIARVKDGDASPAQLILSAIEAGPRGRLINRLVTLPDPARLAEAEQCDCDPRPADQRGFGLKGRIESVDFTAATVTLAHEGIPGVMKAATTAFNAGPELLVAAETGQRVLARIERVGPDWWLLDLRSLVAR